MGCDPAVVADVGAGEMLGKDDRSRRRQERRGREVVEGRVWGSSA